MSATLRLILGSPDPAFSGHEVVAHIQNLTERSREHPTDESRKVVVPGSRPVDVSLEAGRYQIQLILPTGRILYESCTISDGEITPIVFDEPEEASSGFSLQESLGRGGLSSAVERALGASSFSSGVGGSGSIKRFAPGPLNRISRQSRDDLLEATSHSRPSQTAKHSSSFSASSSDRPKGAPTDSLRTPRLTEGKSQLSVGESSQLVGNNAWHTLAAPPSTWLKVSDGWIVAQPEEQEQSVAVWRIESQHDAAEKRRWAISNVRGATEVVSLPQPWFRTSDNQFAATKLLIDAAAKGRAATAVGVSDDSLEGMLAYLDRGRLGAARPIIEALDQSGLITQTIQQKATNPLAACAAAYVGLAIFNPGEAERWDSWLPNIASIAPWLPDASIVHARRIMLRPANPGEYESAMGALERAFDAGIPYYSMGLSLMREMLTLLAPRLSNARTMLAKVNRIASRVDQGQMFTVLRYPRD